jgi:hypothetical protein
MRNSLSIRQVLLDVLVPVISEHSSSSALDDILRNVLLPRLAAFRKLGLRDNRREGVGDLFDAGNWLAGGDEGDDLGKRWWVGRGILLDLGLVVRGCCVSHLGDLRR